MTDYQKIVEALEAIFKNNDDGNSIAYRDGNACSGSWAAYEAKKRFRALREAIPLAREAVKELSAQSSREKEVEVIDPYIMDLVRKHGHEMTNSEIVQNFLPKQKLSSQSSREKALVEAAHELLILIPSNSFAFTYQEAVHKLKAALKAYEGEL